MPARGQRGARVSAVVAACALLLSSAGAHAIWPAVVGAPPAPPAPEPAPAPAAPIDLPPTAAPPADRPVAAFPTVTATVRVLELTAREEPRRDAPVLQTFAEGEPLCVSRDESGGFRRVVLTDGRVAFVATPGLALGADAGGAEGSPARPLVTLEGGAASAAPKAGADVTRIKDLGALARAVSTDDKTWRMTHALERQDLAADVVVALGLGAGAGMMLWGVSSSSSDKRRTLVLSGGLVGLAGPVIGWALSPGRGDLQLVIRTWNDRHPAEQLALE